MPAGASRARAFASVIAAATLIGAMAAADAAADPFPTPLERAFAATVRPRLDIPPPVVEDYARALRQSLREAGYWPLPAQFFVLVDRAPRVQALLLFWQSGTGELRLVGAAPCSTGQPGRFEYFETPLGVFDHTLANPDFRAEGTENDQGIRGYGVAGMRVFDFGWVHTARGWGDRHPGEMRLQMHATDPEHLAQRLGTACSKGCIRIPATLDVFLDHHGVLDAVYEQAAAAGRRPGVLRADRSPSPWAGRYLVVIDSLAPDRPAWARPR